MMANPRDAAAQALTDGLVAHLAGWAARLGAPDDAIAALRQAAAALADAIADGHVCLPLSALATRPGVAPGAPGAPDTQQDEAGWRAALLASHTVGTLAQPGALPLVLDDDGRLYLHRHLDLEQRLARRLLRAAAPLAANAPDRPGPAALATLRTRFSPAGSPQQLAAALALRQRLVVISGGPGTGKTTTVVQLLAGLLAQQPDARVALAAPTGKAAARMTEALQRAATGLPPEVRSQLPAASYTVHRLLGAAPGSSAHGGFRHHAGRRLPIDVLVVDEASMLDLALATRLLEAVPDTARIVLLGDKDQLAAVEAGAVFAELSATPALSPAARDDVAALCGVSATQLPPTPPEPAEGAALPDAAVWFTQGFRFAPGSGIARLAEAVNHGDTAAALACLGRPGGDDAAAGLVWLTDPDGRGLDDATWQAIVAGHAAYRTTAAAAPHDVAGAHAAFERFRVLCALREGPRGAGAVNARLERTAPGQPANGRPAATAAGASPWTLGRPVMVLRNDPALRLFNGDIGLCLPDAGGQWQVWFADGAGGHRPVPPQRLPEHAPAWAMTVHKSQGSEFDAVLVLLPAQPSRVLTRELLYTAITRARSHVAVAGSAEVIAAAVAQRTQRHSGLLARLREAAGRT